MTTIRASRIPLAIACPASSQPPAIPLLGETGPADLGTAAHEALAKHVEGYPFDVHEIADRTGVDADELGMLVGMGIRLWRNIRQHFPAPRTERAMRFEDTENGITLTGTADIVAVPGSEVRINDWKSGRLDEDHSGQVRAYALLGSIAYPQAETAYASVARIRAMSVDGEQFSREELAAWWKRTAARIKQTDSYNPGRHCGHCPRQADCPAFRGVMIQALDVLRGTVEAGGLFGAGPGAVAGEVYDALKLAEKWLQPVKDVLWAATEAAGGTLDTGDGRALTIREQTMTKILPAALPILEQTLGRETALDCLTIGKGKVEAAVKATAGHGGKGKAIQEFMERLGEAGALSQTSSQRLEMQRVGPSAIDHDAHANAAGEPARAYTGSA